MKLQNIDEQEPGVYVRSDRFEQGLDFLWDRDMKKSQEPDRFHLGFFAGGVVTGSLVTFAICFFFLFGGKLLPASAPAVNEPVAIEEKTLNPEDLEAQTAQNELDEKLNQMLLSPSAQELPAAVERKVVTPSQPENRTVQEKPENKSSLFPFFAKTKTPQPELPKPVVAAPQHHIYEVKSGDTLGSISSKFYNTVDPAMITKVQNANHLTSADTLEIGQKLMIPSGNQ